jgi:hypothetical protein
VRNVNRDEYEKVVEDYMKCRVDLVEARRELPEFREYTDRELHAKLILSWNALHAKETV